MNDIPQYPWAEGEKLYASALNAAIANAGGITGAASGIINVKNYGAKGDGVTDDTAGVQAALNAAAGGGDVWFPAGTYFLASAVSLSPTQNVHVHGAGTGVSILKCSSSGIAIALPSNSCVTVSDLTFARAATGSANTGLSIISPDQSATCRMYNLEFGNQAQMATTSWATAISIVGQGVPILDAIKIWMPNGTGSAGPIGITYAGNDTTHTATGLRIANSFIQGGQYGVHMGNNTEGLYLVATDIIGTDYCVYWSPTAGASNWLTATSCHFNCNISGVYVRGVNFIQLVNNFFLRGGGTAPWVAVDIGTAAYVTISGNNVYGAQTGTETCISINNAATGPVSITGNVLQNTTGYGIVLSGNTAAAVIVGNAGTALTAGGIHDTTGNSRTNQTVANSFNGALDVNANPNGIAYAGLAGGGNAIGFAWKTTGTQPYIHAYVDGTDEGAIAAGVPAVNAANDAAAASAGVGVGGFYRNGSALMVRVA